MLFDDEFPYEPPVEAHLLVPAAPVELLDPEQLELAHAIPDGISLGSAGAGSGKTRTIRHRVPFLLRYRDDEFNTKSKVLVMAFGKDIAQELNTYFDGALVAEDRARVTVRTFHSMAGSLLYKFRSYSKVTAKQIERIKPYHLIQDFTDWASTQHHQRFKSGAAKLLLWIEGESLAKNRPLLRVIGDNKRLLTERLGMEPAAIAEWVERFAHWRYATGKLTFDDQLPLANALPAWCFKKMEFTDLIADELQDLNHQQRRLVKHFMAYAKSFTGIGDAAQSIFSFSGADEHIFENMRRDYPEARMYPMHTNYRCTDQILALCNKVLEHDLHLPMRLRGIGRQGPAPLLYTDGAAGLISWLHMRRASGEAWKDIMVLYRTKNDTPALELALTQSGVPYVLRDSSFFEHNVVQDLVCYLKLLYHPKPSWGDWRRTMNHFKGLGEVAAKAVWDATGEKPLSWSGGVPAVVSRYNRENSWYALWNLLDSLREVRGSVNTVVASLVDVLTPGWESYYADAGPRYLEECLKMAEITREWVKAFGPAVTGWDVVKTIELMENGNRQHGEDADAVQVMTIHKSKGLEFNSGAVWNVRDGSLPLTHSNANPGEERRLGYVAFSRVKTHLAVICPSSADRLSTFARHLPTPKAQLNALLEDLDLAS